MMQAQPSSSITAPRSKVLKAQPFSLSKMDEGVIEGKDKKALKDLSPSSSQTTVELLDHQSGNCLGAKEMWKGQSHTYKVPISDTFATRESIVSDVDAGGVGPQFKLHKVDFEVVDRSEPNKGYTSQFERLFESQCSIERFGTKQLRLSNTQRPLEMSEVAEIIHNKNQDNWQQDRGVECTQTEPRDEQELCHRFNNKWYHRHRYKHKGVEVLNDIEGLPKVKESEVVEEYEKALDAGKMMKWWAAAIEWGK